MWLAVACATAAAALVAVLAHGSDRRQRQRLLRGAPRYTVTDLPEGIVGLLIGVAQPIGGNTIAAPLTGKPCLYYFLRVLRLGDEHAERTLVEESRGVEMFLDDDAGRALVDPSGAISALAVDATRHYYAAQLHGALLALIVRTHRPLPPHAHLVFEESRIEPDQRIAVIGRGSRQEGRLRLDSGPHAPLVLSDNTKMTRAKLPIARVRR